MMGLFSFLRKKRAPQPCIPNNCPECEFYRACRTHEELKAAGSNLYCFFRHKVKPLNDDQYSMMVPPPEDCPRRLEPVPTLMENLLDNSRVV